MWLVSSNTNFSQVRSDLNIRKVGELIGSFILTIYLILITRSDQKLTNTTERERNITEDVKELLSGGCWWQGHPLASSRLELVGRVKGSTGRSLESSQTCQPTSWSTSEIQTKWGTNKEMYNILTFTRCERISLVNVKILYFILKVERQFYRNIEILK